MRGERQVLYSQEAQIVNALEDRKPKMQWCLCPLNSEDFTGDIFLPDQGEVNIGRAILGINDRKISRNHLGIRIQDRELSIKLLHKNPCHVKKAGQSLPQEIPSDHFIKLTEGDQISLMMAYAYAVDFKDISEAQPPKFRPRTNSALTTVDDGVNIRITNRHHYVAYQPTVPRHLERGLEEEEEVDEEIPKGPLESHMSYRDPDKEVPGPDRYHNDWLIVAYTDDVRQVAPDIPGSPDSEQEQEEEDEDDAPNSMFSNHSEEKPSYRILYKQNQLPKKKEVLWRNICGKTPSKND